jgi:hypothetical protein
MAARLETVKMITAMLKTVSIVTGYSLRSRRCGARIRARLPLFPAIRRDRVAVGGIDVFLANQVQQLIALAEVPVGRCRSVHRPSRGI